MGTFGPISALPPYSLREEVANSITHGIGVLFAVVATTLMLASTIPGGVAAHIAACAIYGLSMFLVFLASTLYHAIPFPKAKARLKIFDHCAIYLLIAGTYTPFLIVSLKGQLADQMLVMIWALALVGVAFKIMFVKRFKALSIATYLGMGWLSLLVFDELADAMAEGGLWMLALGGVAYSVGVFFYVNKKIPYNHAIWHLFVLAGAVLHFVSIFNFVLPSWWFS